MVLKKTQERVKTLLKDTITLLCKNGLEFKTKFNIEALIGVTLDDDEVFLISMNELIRSDAIAEQEQPNDADDAAPDTTTKPSSKKRRRRSLNSDDGVRVKLEPDIQPPSDTPEEDFWAADDPQSPSGMLGDDSNNYDQPQNPAKRQHTDDSTHRLKSEELEDEDSEDIVIVKEEGRDCFSDFQSPSFPSFQPSQPGGSGWSPAVGYSGYQQSSASSATITSDQSVLNQASPGQQYPRQQTSQNKKRELPCRRGCDKLFRDSSTRKRHEEGPAHNTEPSYNCTCGSKFFSGAALNKHKRIIHPAKHILHYCDKCSFSSAYKQTVTNHIRALHEGLNKCPTCKKSFNSMSTLKLHIDAVHDNVTHKCDKCDAVFKFKGNMKHHQKVMHSNTSFICSTCGKTFKWNSALCRHVKKEHTS